MERQTFSKGQADAFMAFKGKIRGVGLKNYADYIIKEDGEESLKKVEEVSARVGYPIKYKTLRNMDFYPLGYQAITIEAIRQALGYTDEKFYELGNFEPKVSLIVKLFLKYFVSMDRLAREAPNMWKKYYTVGDINITELNKNQRFLIIRLENFPCHPIQCHETLRGYFARMVQMVVAEEVISKETKCVFRGDPYHEYQLSW